MAVSVESEYRDLIEGAYRQYASIPPQDRKDAFWRVGWLAWNLIRTYGPEAADPLDDKVFGAPVHIIHDPGTDPMMLELAVESPWDRDIRRARQNGITVNVMQVEPISLPATLPDPTLRALLKHWRKKWSKQ